MQKPSERHEFTSENNIIKFKKPFHDPFKIHSHQNGPAQECLQT